MNWIRRHAFTLSLGLTSLLLRVPRLSARPVWYDEAFSLLLARQPWGEIVRGTAADTMPPLYYFLLNLWLHLGGGVAGARLLNVILGTVAVLVIYRWLAELLGEREGRLAGVMAALSPLLIYHAQELRMYTLLLLGSALFAWGSARLLRADSLRSVGAVNWWMVLGGGALAMYSHNLAIFTLAVPLGLALLNRNRAAVGRMAVATLAVLALAGPWLAYLPGQIAKIQSAFWTPRPGLLEVLQAAMTIHTNLPVPDRWIPLALAATILTAALTAYTLLREGVGERGPAQLAAFLLLPPAMLFVVSHLMRPLFVARAFILSAVTYYGLVAWAAWRGPQPLQRYLLPAALLVPSLLLLPAQYRYQSFPRSPFDQAAAYLQEHVTADTVVVHDNKLSYFPLLIYAPELPMEFVRDEPGSHNDTLAADTQQVMGLTPAVDIAAAIDGAEKVWFVDFERAEEEFRQLGYDQHPHLAWLSAHYELSGQESFNDLNLYLFRQGK